MDQSTLRRVNLIEVLGEKYPWKLEHLPEAATLRWTESQLTEYFEGAGSTALDKRLDHCGGVVKQDVDPEVHKHPPPEVRAHQLQATVGGYRRQVILDGIPFRENGLFPPGEPFLLSLAAQPDLHPFEKHLAGTRSPQQLLEQGSWVSGNAAAQNGFDLRLFWQERSGLQGYGTVVGAARLGDRASIGNGYWMSAHGGAVESLLDEATAELSKMEFSPIVSTIELANFRIKKPVPLHTSLRIDCSIASIEGLRCWVTGTVSLPDTGAVLATAEAQLVDLKQLWDAQGL